MKWGATAEFIVKKGLDLAYTSSVSLCYNVDYNIWGWMWKEEITEEVTVTMQRRHNVDLIWKGYRGGKKGLEYIYFKTHWIITNDRLDKEQEMKTVIEDCFNVFPVWWKNGLRSTEMGKY